jgi:hypothetical protein
MPLRRDAISSELSGCQWINIREALHHFATYSGPTQSQYHIKPLHWYVACRLVLEGGFHPDDVTPRPPFRVETRKGKDYLNYDPALATNAERTILGGLKTKNVDVVVTKDGIGPVLAVSCKGMTGAFRNLTNRMEETIGECTNLHITYPALVFGYMFVIRANAREIAVSAEVESDHLIAPSPLGPNDIAIATGGTPVESIVRFHSALRELTGRRGIRDEVSGYEAVMLAMIQTKGDRTGDISPDFPSVDSPLRSESFFATLYRRYEERYVFGAPDLKYLTRRLEWAPTSPLFDAPEFQLTPLPVVDYELRLAAV